MNSRHFIFNLYEQWVGVFVFGLKMRKRKKDWSAEILPCTSITHEVTKALPMNKLLKSIKKESPFIFIVTEEKALSQMGK